MVLRRCLRLFAMVLRRLDCLRCDCSDKQSKQLDCLAWSLGLFAFMNHWGKTMNSAGNTLSTIAQRLLPMVLRLLSAEFTGPSPSHFCDAWIGQKYEFIFLNSGKHQSGRSTFLFAFIIASCLCLSELYLTHTVCVCVIMMCIHIHRFFGNFFGTTPTQGSGGVSKNFSDGSVIRYFQRHYPKSLSLSLPPPLKEMRQKKQKKLSFIQWWLEIPKPGKKK